MNVRTQVRLVIFDWAGTIIDFGAFAPTGAFGEVFAARGVEVTTAEARAPMGLHKKDHLRTMLQMPAVAERWAAVRGAAWTEEDLEEMYQELVPRQVEAIGRHDRLIPGTVECVTALRQRGLLIGGTTGYFRAAAELCLRAAAEQGFVPDHSVCGDDVPAGRPAPWMLFRVMERLAVWPPAAVVKVGDTFVDVEEGLNAGAWSVAVTSSSSEMGLTAEEWGSLPAGERWQRGRKVAERFRSAGAHFAIESLGQLPALVEQLNRRLALGDKP